MKPIELYIAIPAIIVVAAWIVILITILGRKIFGFKKEKEKDEHQKFDN